VRESHEYTVRPGDTLSALARRYLRIARRWEGLYAANRDAIGRNPNRLRNGAVIQLVNRGLTANMARHIRNELRRLLREAREPIQRPAGTGSGEPTATVSTATPDAPDAVASSSGPSSSWSGTYPGGSFGACVVARESGGNPQVMNATGHWGLYQFSAQTWAAYGGNPADFGSAGVAEQNQVFANALAQGGQSNWSPYDGC
jgi:hypothetical protein